MEKFTPRTVHLKNQPVCLREATAADAQSVIEFSAVIAKETPFTLYYPGQQIKLESMAAHLVAEQNSRCNLKIIATDGTQVMGQIAFWRPAPDHPWLQHKGEFSLEVVKEWWGSGLAKALLAAMESFARSTGAKRIGATVNCTNERGMGLYAKSGFVIEGTAKGYKIVDGIAYDSFYIAKLL